MRAENSIQTHQLLGKAEKGLDSYPLRGERVIC